MLVHSNSVNNGNKSPRETYELKVALPRSARLRTWVNAAAVHFPYYLTTFAGFLATSLSKTDKIDWQDVLTRVIGKVEFHNGFRQAARKVKETDHKAMCRTILCDWMKQTPRQNDKVEPILDALRRKKLCDLADDCQHFVEYQKNELADSVLHDIARKTPRGFGELASALKIEKERVDICKEQGERPKDRILLLLFEWRESDEVITHGDKAQHVLKLLCRV